jgi:hypothetical protein
MLDHVSYKYCMTNTTSPLVRDVLAETALELKLPDSSQRSCNFPVESPSSQPRGERQQPMIAKLINLGIPGGLHRLRLTPQSSLKSVPGCTRPGQIVRSFHPDDDFFLKE